MKFLQRLATTLKDSQRLGRWDGPEVYLSDCERPSKTANDPVVYVIWKQIKIPLATTNNPENRKRLAVSKIGATSSNVNEDFERPSMTLKDRQ